MFKDFKTREYNFIELFKATRYVYNKNLKYIFLVCLFVYIPIVTILALMPIQVSLDNLNETSLGEIGFNLNMILAVYIIFAPLATSAFTYIAKQTMENNKVSFQGVLDFSLMKWGKLSVSYFFACMAITLSIMIIVPLFSFMMVYAFALGAVLILPALYFTVVFAFVVHVAAITDRWGIRSLLISMRLVKGRFFNTALAMGFVFLMTLTMNVSVASLAGEITGLFEQILFSFIVEILCSFFQILICLLFLQRFYLKQDKV